MESNGTAPAKGKEKRERQPNWTEAEKQLLLSLTRMHQAILENKGSDTMTIKRKSEAWDDIATNMRVAGYQRSKERLKQQLGRIRAAEAKKAKDALAKGLAATAAPAVGCSSHSTSVDGSLLREKKPRQLSVTSAALTPIERDSIQIMPTPLHEEIEIKIEKATSLNDFEASPPKLSIIKSHSHLLESSEAFSCPASVVDIGGLGKREMRRQEPFLNMQPLVMRGDVIGLDDMANELPTPSARRNSQCCDYRQGKRKPLRVRISGQAPRTRMQRIRQLHLYRVAVEKERLKMLRLQQKRDRIFYRKDKQIQNLKLQILRNLAMNRINHINFT